MKRGEKQAAVDGVKYWFHSIDFGDGVVSPGTKSQEQLRGELDGLQLPDLSGKTVLDIGAWDGFFSFEAERRGARRVVALDYFVWSLDLPAMIQYAERRDAAGKVRSLFDRVPGVWQPWRLPGKAGFDTAHALLGSNVEHVIADFRTTDPVSLGSFDIVLFLGVLYHLENPLAAMRKLSLLTRELAIIETASIAVPDREQEALWEFYGENELAHDSSNWWAPSLTGLKSICVAAGFRRVEMTGGGGPPAASPDAPIQRQRLIVQAWK
jgi:tRNA (mo5U34)-methyltransferase